MCSNLLYGYPCFSFPSAGFFATDIIARWRLQPRKHQIMQHQSRRTTDQQCGPLEADIYSLEDKSLRLNLLADLALLLLELALIVYAYYASNPNPTADFRQHVRAIPILHKRTYVHHVLTPVVTFLSTNTVLKFHTPQLSDVLLVLHIQCSHLKRLYLTKWLTWILPNLLILSRNTASAWEDLVELDNDEDAAEYYVGTEKGKPREEEKTKRMRKMTKTGMKIAERKRKPRDCWFKDQVVLKSLADTWSSASPSITQSQVYIYYYIVICLVFHFLVTLELLHAWSLQAYRYYSHAWCTRAKKKTEMRVTSSICTYCTFFLTSRNYLFQPPARI